MIRHKERVVVAPPWERRRGSAAADAPPRRAPSWTPFRARAARVGYVRANSSMSSANAASISVVTVGFTCAMAAR
jgi:hypothetical protein